MTYSGRLACGNHIYTDKEFVKILNELCTTFIVLNIFRNKLTCRLVAVEHFD